MRTVMCFPGRLVPLLVLVVLSRLALTATEKAISKAELGKKRIAEAPPRWKLKNTSLP